MNIETIILGNMETNTYIITNGTKECIIIDPSIDEILNYIIKDNLKPTYILLTHGHFDHIGGIEAIKNKYNDAKIVCCKKETGILNDHNLNLSNMINLRLCVTPDITVEDNQILDILGLKIKVVETPGHSVGSVTYLIEDNVFSGDTLFLEGYGRYDFPTGSLSDLRKSIKKVLNIEGNLKVYPGHGDVTALDYERKFNPLR